MVLAYTWEEPAKLFLNKAMQRCGVLFSVGFIRLPKKQNNLRWHRTADLLTGRYLSQLAQFGRAVDA